MRPAARLLAVAAAALLLGAGGGYQGTTLYVNRVVVASPGDVSLGALVRSSSALSAEALEAMSRSATVLRDSIQYLPVSQYQPLLDSAFGADAILVGSWSLIVPRGTSAEGQGYLLDRLADYLISQNLLADARVDISFSIAGLKGTAPQDGTPSFQVVRTARGVDVHFSLSAADGSSVTGRATLPPAAGPDTAEGVRQNAPVRVVFRKGPLTVEMPGKALASASVGDTVKVFVADSQKTFTGRLAQGKAVQVDLP